MSLNNNYIHIFCFVAMIGFSTSAIGQQNEQLKDTTLVKRNSLFGVPIAFFSPETDWAFGVTGIYAFRFKKENVDTRPSQLTLGFAYTLNNNSTCKK